MRQFDPLKPFLLGLAVCAAGGVVARFAHVPLPWMIGPLLAMAGCRFGGLDARAPAFARPAGQVIIGTALGVYFTPQIVRELLHYLPIMIAAGFASMLTGYLASVVLAHWAKVDRVSAFFASVPGGAAEMSVLAERVGARPEQVAVGQSLRIALVVMVFPAVFQYAGLAGTDAYEQAQKLVEPAGLTELLAAGAACGFLLRYFDVPNAFTIGALLASVALTLSGQTSSAVPAPLSNLGQLLIGCTLGSRFNRDFLHRAPRFLAALFASILLAMLLSVLVGLTLAWFMERPWPTLVLATAPGGIAEMSITAKVLRLGVPIVTAFHVTRMVILVTLTAPLYKLALALTHRKEHRP
ncbi:MAG: AbrB family transcriptional regulator [Rhodospirillales bacterium]